MPNYTPQAIEPKWQKYWQDHKTFATPDTSSKPKYYILDMFPYPSGAGLHVGHPEGYTATDILARYRRMRGDHVLHPMGWDAFGLPAEQYAIETGTHPRETTRKNVETFRRQIQSLGFSYDWDREVDTTDPGYYRWTQWIFLELYDTWFDDEQQRGRPIKELPIPADVRSQGEADVRRYQDSKRLAYLSEVPVNWCPVLGTVLANEEVIDGKSERGGHPVIRTPLKQWLLRITAYAERLLNDLDTLDWSDALKEMQRNWIGKSEGAEIRFMLPSTEVVREVKADVRDLESRDDFMFATAKFSISTMFVEVFTTRPDTLFGATYMVLSPEHPLVEGITTPEQSVAVKAYQEAAARKSDLERTELAKTKTGVFTGAYAVNPATNKEIPIWIADYVLASYGTGAIMAVPGQDERDWEFAEVYNLPIVRTVQPPVDWTGKAYLGEGPAINSGFLDGLGIENAKAKMIAWLEKKGIGKRRVNYKLRDWLFSRQRYWGEPFPILHELDAAGNPTGLMRPVPLDQLPVRLPDLEDFKPTGSPEGPLVKAADWLHVTIDGKEYRRETNTMPQWAGSCWYYLRYLDPRNDKSFCAPEKAKRWLPVDLYVGGAEHAVLHLLYSRFWHKVLYDRGHVPTPEPFRKLVNQGMILGEMEFTGYETKDGRPVSFPLGSKSDQGWIEITAEVTINTETGTVQVKNELPKIPFVLLNEVRIPEDEVERVGKVFFRKGYHEILVFARAHKMAKQRGNVINPDTVVNEYGADSLRLYEMFMGPLEQVKPWSMRGVEGVYRFLSAMWRLVIDDRAEVVKLNDAVRDITPDRETLRELHRTIKKVTDDLDGMRFNTAISTMMEFKNYLNKLDVRPRSVLDPFVLILAPFAPHIAEELWQALGHANTLAYEPWPVADPAMLKADTIEVPVQVNGKLRSRIVVPADSDEKALEATAMADEKVQANIAGKTIKKVIVVKGKLVNFVVSG